MYKYLFYKIRQVVGIFTDSPTFGAIIIMCWLFMFNSFSMLYLIGLNYEISMILDTYASIIGGVVVFGGHLLYFYRKSISIFVHEKYKKESELTSIIGFVVLFIYIAGSIILHWGYVIPKMDNLIK
ncbi:hypothetical protein L3073_14030 [Ancylomarina sp. DW003]|nr:hypothetical protein [Ancylomarina sp. DW003]MDE5423334.1 hypothetical protein [Ancylomarina sp. DW003]